MQFWCNFVLLILHIFCAIFTSALHSFYGRFAIFLHYKKKTNRLQARIVQGVSTKSGTWSFIVRLSFYMRKPGKPIQQSLCGGTIINNHFILTAAHCCYDQTSVTMYFNDQDRSSKIVRDGWIDVGDRTSWDGTGRPRTVLVLSRPQDK